VRGPYSRGVCTSYEITAGEPYTLKGTQFNGLSQGAAYGDDAQSATNFPLVRISIGPYTDFYLPTKTFTMGVATGSKVVQTEFTMVNLGTGTGTLEVVANGIPSNPVTVTVK
jgi:hypothetical protein